MSQRGPLRRLLPDWPRRRYGVFTGTNTTGEWWSALKAVLRPCDPHSPDGRQLLEAYERAFAEAAGTRHAFAFGAGRMGLYALVEALGLEPQDEVIVPAFTCVVVPNAYVYRGLRPIYADIDPVTFNLDAGSLEQHITSRTRAIHVQHTFGVGADIEALGAVAERHGLLLIEDAAHSLGAVSNGKPHGSLGRAGFFSTDRTKVINTHLGGMVTTDDDELALRLAALQSAAPFLRCNLVRRILFSFVQEFALFHPALLWLGRPLAGGLRRLGMHFTLTDELSLLRPDPSLYPHRLSPDQARLGRSQLEQLDHNLAHRRKLAAWLEQRIGWYGDALPGAFDDHTWLRYSFLVADRPAFEERLSRRFDLGVWFTSPLFGRPDDPQALGFVPGSCPVAEHAAAHIVNFPTHQRLPLSALQDLWQRDGDWIAGQVLRPDA